MKVLSKAAFLDLPVGTLFMKGSENGFYQLGVKGETIRSETGPLYDDFFFLDLQNTCFNGGECAIEHLLESGASMSIRDSYGKDGDYNPDALFLVYQPDDLKVLARIISAALAASAGTSIESES